MRKLLAYLNSKEFQEMIQPGRKVTGGEDLADSIGLMVIMALVLFCIFI